MEPIVKFLRVLKCQLNILTHRTFILPFVVITITTRCNSKCVTCDFWRNQNRDELTLPEMRNLADSVKKLDIRSIALTGGEPLMHPDFSNIVLTLGKTQAKLKMATNGTLLEEYAPLVSRFFTTVLVSLDGGSPEVYRKVRGIDAFANVVAGVKKLKRLNPSILVFARTVIQKYNYFELVPIIKTAKDMGADYISFVSADIKSSSFGRNGTLGQVRAQHILLDENDLIRFKDIIQNLKKAQAHYFSSRFIIEGYRNLLNIYNYYGAMIGKLKFFGVSCNLPWRLIVMQPNGDVRPCCFHREMGNIRKESFEQIVKSVRMIEFRRKLKKKRQAMCSGCIFSSANIHLKMLYESI